MKTSSEGRWRKILARFAIGLLMVLLAANLMLFAAIAWQLQRENRLRGPFLLKRASFASNEVGGGAWLVFDGEESGEIRYNLENITEDVTDDLQKPLRKLSLASKAKFFGPGTKRQFVFDSTTIRYVVAPDGLTADVYISFGVNSADYSFFEVEL